MIGVEEMEKQHKRINYRDNILAAVREIVKRKNLNEFEVGEIIDFMFSKDQSLNVSTIRTHIASRCCVNASPNHAVTYNDYERIGKGLYRLFEGHERNKSHYWGGSKKIDLSEMEYFKATIGGYSGPSYSVEADACRGNVKYTGNEDGMYYPELTESRPLTSEAWDTLIKGMKDCDFEDWLVKYIDQHILDGTQWSVEIRLNSGKSLSKYGSNRYPDKWKQFCQVVSSFAGGKFE